MAMVGPLAGNQTRLKCTHTVMMKQMSRVCDCSTDEKYQRCFYEKSFNEYLKKKNGSSLWEKPSLAVR